eukprot:m.268805 g.268805  ORF g.268805 m.268805 type:complete len:65 (-) comp15662_c0_seq4:4511-4705(-)
MPRVLLFSSLCYVVNLVLVKEMFRLSQSIYQQWLVIFPVLLHALLFVCLFFFLVFPINAKYCII